MTSPVPHLESAHAHEAGFTFEWWHVSTDPDRYEHRIPGTTMRVTEEDVPNYGACYSWNCGNPLHIGGWPAQVGATRRLADAWEHWIAEHSSTVERVTEGAEKPRMASLEVKVSELKALRETLCLAQQVVPAPKTGEYGIPDAQHLDRLQHLINEIDRHRPLGSDGKHDDLHTPTCGCEDR